MRMMHTPDGTKEQRLEQAETEHRSTIIKLMEGGWGNSSIAAYLGIDIYTIKRFRSKHGLQRRSSGT